MQVHLSLQLLECIPENIILSRIGSKLSCVSLQKNTTSVVCTALELTALILLILLNYVALKMSMTTFSSNNPCALSMSTSLSRKHAHRRIFIETFLKGCATRTLLLGVGSGLANCDRGIPTRTYQSCPYFCTGIPTITIILTLILMVTLKWIPPRLRKSPFSEVRIIAFWFLTHVIKFSSYYEVFNATCRKAVGLIINGTIVWSLPKFLLVSDNI